MKYFILIVSILFLSCKTDNTKNIELAIKKHLETENKHKVIIHEVKCLSYKEVSKIEYLDYEDSVINSNIAYWGKGISDISNATKSVKLPGEKISVLVPDITPESRERRIDYFSKVKELQKRRDSIEVEIKETNEILLKVKCLLIFTTEYGRQNIEKDLYLTREFKVLKEFFVI